jgi:uroporphyrinogen decarboxylase
LLEGGNELTLATQNLLDVLGKGPYVFNLGHGILPQTPVTHVQHVIDLVRQI